MFPVDRPEPFGLVMIEAMACGTPVLAFRGGSIPEVIDVGVIGNVVDSEDEAIGALPAILSYDRRGAATVCTEIYSHKNGPQLSQYLSPIVEEAHAWPQASSTCCQWWQRFDSRVD